MMQPLEDYQPKFHIFRSLMPHRVRRILLVSSLYDAFVLEEDGTLGDRLWDRYVEMRLTMTPAVQRVSTGAQALEVIDKDPIDLVLTMARISDIEPFAFAQEVKKRKPTLPVVLLLIDPAELRHLPVTPERSPIDKIFLWNNNSEILLAIIKLIEDRANVDHDTVIGGVRVIILIEDSCVYYSVFVPAMYTVIMQLTRQLIAEGLNTLHKQLRTRSRAKVLLAETYEEGLQLYRKYRPYLLGVVSDVEYWRGRQLDPEAGFALTREIRAEMPDLPILLQSSDPGRNRHRAHELGAHFLDKGAPSLLDDYRSFLVEYMGFGDFVFRMPDGHGVARARDVHEMLDMLHRVPIESVVWHAERNHFSHWMMARTELTIADQLRPRRVTDFADAEGLRRWLILTIQEVLTEKQSDVVAEFSSKRTMHHSDFVHVGSGSLGGKGRGIAFLRFVLARSRIAANYPGVRIEVPPALVVGAAEFSAFLDDNRLRRFAMECDDLAELTHRFAGGDIRAELVESLRAYVERTLGPIAVRSSSLLEDSHLQPFAGLYATVMLPNMAPETDRRLHELLRAIKMVWASTFGPDAKAYFKATVHRIEEEEMAIVVQRLVGQHHDDYFYPTCSGTAQSYNFYPVSHMRPEDGIAQLALGLGKMVVEGGATVRFCPAYPQILPQFARPEDWIRLSQRQFYALDVTASRGETSIDPDSNLTLLDLSEAEKHRTLQRVGSVYSVDDHRVRDGLTHPGPRIVSFANILKYEDPPVSSILVDLLATCRDAFGCPVEIEFAIDLDAPGGKPLFALLQVRPLIATGEKELVTVGDEHRKDAWCHTYRALGNGVKTSIRDIVYVRPGAFDKARTREIAADVGEINKVLVEQGYPYVLIGLGRWGTFDPWLGIGVTWAQISGVGVIIEAGLENFLIDPSQGTHFFQNMTSLGIGYLSVPYGAKQASIDWEWLDAQPAFTVTKYLRHVRLDAPTEVRIDGRSGQAALLRPR